VGLVGCYGTNSVTKLLRQETASLCLEDGNNSEEVVRGGGRRVAKDLVGCMD
jgi:hypothetical protein